MEKSRFKGPKRSGCVNINMEETKEAMNRWSKARLGEIRSTKLALKSK